MLFKEGVWKFVSLYWHVKCGGNDKNLPESIGKKLLKSRLEENVNWILHEDNDPKQWSPLYTEWKAENKIQQLNGSLQSPYVNLIGNVQAYIEHKLHGKTYKWPSS